MRVHPSSKSVSAKAKARTEKAKALKRNENALTLLGLNDVQKIQGEWVDEKNRNDGNCVYETARGILCFVLSNVICTHTIFPYKGYIANVSSMNVLQKTFDAIMLHDFEVKMIHDVFKTIDVDGSGSLSLKEFYNAFHFTYVTALAERYFNIFDQDSSGELSFCEFIVATWNFCANTDKVGMINMAFDVYDLDKSGFIDAKEVNKLLEEAYGDVKRMSQHTMQVVQQLSRMGDMDLQMPKTAFVTFVMRNESTFFPIFTLQREMRKHVCGDNFWDRIRKAMCKRCSTEFKAPNFGLDHCRRAIDLSRADVELQNAFNDNPFAADEVSPVQSFHDGYPPSIGGAVVNGDDDDNMSVASSASSVASRSSRRSKRGSSRKPGSRRGGAAKSRRVPAPTWTLRTEFTDMLDADFCDLANIRSHQNLR